MCRFPMQLNVINKRLDRCLQASASLCRRHRIFVFTIAYVQTGTPGMRRMINYFS